MSIDALQSLEMIAGSISELERALEVLRTEWSPDELPITVAMGELGRCLAGACAMISEADVDGVTSVIERIMESGTEDAKNAVATGLLEAVLAAGDSDSGVVRVTRRLGPLARQYCREWDQFNGCRSPGIWD